MSLRTTRESYRINVLETYYGSIRALLTIDIYAPDIYNLILLSKIL